MTVYHVWKPGQGEPEVVEADHVGECAGIVQFINIQADAEFSIVRQLVPHEWSRWSVVPDDASSTE